MRSCIARNSLRIWSRKPASRLDRGSSSNSSSGRVIKRARERQPLLLAAGQLGGDAAAELARAEPR